MNNRLLELYKKIGLYETSKITGMPSYELLNVLKQPIDTEMSKNVLDDLLLDGKLPIYKDIDIDINIDTDTFDGVWYLDKKFDIEGDRYIVLYSMATPFWDGADILPFDTTNYTVYNKKGDVLEDFDVEIYDAVEANGNFKNIEELIKWYKNFYLPHVEMFFEKHFEKIMDEKEKFKTIFN